jgi:ABC-2 type transport system permease protein
VVFLPMSFLSGVAIPLFAMPQVVQSIAPLWPAYHLNQISHAAIGQAAQGSVLEHVLVLAAFAAVCFALARRRLARGE